MKHLILTAALLWATATTAQTTRDAAGNFHATVDTAQTTTPYTYTDNKGKVWPVFVTAKGAHYIQRTSAKTGKAYRQYLKTEAQPTNAQP